MGPADERARAVGRDRDRFRIGRGPGPAARFCRTAALIEVAAFAALAVLALSPAAQRRPAGPVASRSGVLARLQAGLPGARAAAAAVSVAALVLLGVAVAGAGGPGASAAGELGTAQIGGTTVLADAKGFTLYSFAPDTRPDRTAMGRALATGRL